jgi:hypothetical protein
VTTSPDDFLTQLERGHRPDRFDGDLHALAHRHGHDGFHGLAFGAVDDGSRAQLLGHGETIIIEVSHVPVSATT